MAFADSTVSDGNLHKATLLFVDDERRVLSSMRAMFRREYHVFVADSGQEALEIVDREKIDVVISDQRMPKMTGVEFLCAVKEKSPDAMRILLTGYADLEAIEASINDGEVFRYLMKPCPPDDLKKAIAMAVEATRDREPDVEEIELQALEPRKSGEPAELIPFPGGKRPPRTKATVHPIRATAEPLKPVVGRRRQAGSSNRVDILVLSKDKALHAAVVEVAGEHEVVRALSVDQALEALSKNRVGVMITDITADGSDLESLTKALKQEVPELVTIIASERSDAHTLISLINEGQIYRFLLKPISKGQCRLWVTSAIRKFTELAGNAREVARYRVATVEDPAQTGWLESFRIGLQKLRARLKDN